MPVEWHPTRWWSWCMPEDKKELKLFLINEKHYEVVGIVSFKINTLINYFQGQNVPIPPNYILHYCEVLLQL